jgi:cytoskeletal protein CcmA (bactofilin family)
MQGKRMATNQKPPPQFPANLGRRVVNIPGPPRPESLPGGSEGRRLIVGREICLSGEITACDTLVVEGQVEATLNQSHRIEITESGNFKGQVDIDIAEIKGHFEGDLIAHERLIIRKSGRVTGNIQYGEVEIERGGVLDGNVKVIPRPEPEDAKPLPADEDSDAAS